ncbi:MAG TPA: 50S ribosomal protein L9 [Pyrinomonadaceae bacterium]|nr:50S ribosomal protein L9 [Pyrinomonadaceae bacterium]
MANTTILLREDIDSLGGRGEIVKVKAGYARNYLLPQNLATLATKGNVKQIEQEREALLKRAATEKATAEAQRDQMSALSFSFARKVSEHGQLFGSVTSMDIAEALKEKGYEIDRRKIVLKEAIKETGNFTVPVKLYREVTLQLPITVTTEDGEIIEKAVEEKAAAPIVPMPTEDTPAAEAEVAETTEEVVAESEEVAS